MNSETPERQISDARLEQRLRNKAMHYLSRYASTTAKLEGVLRRFALRKIGELPPTQLNRSIEAVIDNCVRAGYVDDGAFIRSRFRSARTSGQSFRMIATKLKAAGISAARIDAEWQAMLATEQGDDSQPLKGMGPENMAETPASEDEIELVAAIQFARKKKLGCFATIAEDADPFALKQSALARLARRGFRYQICAEVLDFEHGDDALARIDEISARLPASFS
jgi:regulatory protein